MNLSTKLYIHAAINRAIFFAIPFGFFALHIPQAKADPALGYTALTLVALAWVWLTARLHRKYMKRRLVEHMLDGKISTRSNP
jgi:hypothetical protein